MNRSKLCLTHLVELRAVLLNLDVGLTTALAGAVDTAHKFIRSSRSWLESVASGTDAERGETLLLEALNLLEQACTAYAEATNKSIDDVLVRATRIVPSDSIWENPALLSDAGLRTTLEAQVRLARSDDGIAVELAEAMAWSRYVEGLEFPKLTKDQVEQLHTARLRLRLAHATSESVPGGPPDQSIVVALL